MWTINKIPSSSELETRLVYRELVAARAALAELKGVADSMPNQAILVNTLGMQEAKDSSAIENIITTMDELFKISLALNRNPSPEAKEVQNYIVALKTGFSIVDKKKLLTSNSIISIQETLEKNNAGFRRTPGTALKNANTGETVYIPPQDYAEISSLMADLEKLINDDEYRDYDPLVKMAIIHFQFESIHPFYDGNGRTGRIINILYLILQGLLDYPILYLSNYIIKNKTDYYRLLQNVREKEDWESWLIYMIRSVKVTAEDTISMIRSQQLQMQDMKQRLKRQYKFYSYELLLNLFKHPYTKSDFLVRDVGVTKKTAAGYLNKMAEDGILRKEVIGNNTYYVNEDLYHLFLMR
ncbi:MAG: Fic family protein [Lewinella sp.]